MLEEVVEGEEGIGLRVYNTSSRTKEEFVPIEEGKAKIYVCGPTVNDVPHLGHARQQITFDILRRFLQYGGYDVEFVTNITDIEDKIITKARELGEDIGDLTRKNIQAHREDYKLIGVSPPDSQPLATEYVEEMIDVIARLEEKGFAYTIPGNGVYYDISKFEGYGMLSGQEMEGLETGARVESKEGKRDDRDFVLWKFSKPEEPKWESPWGEGRPGWHIECSAMSANILGLPFDIHGGGQDLVFPHHENEIAQSEAAFDRRVANYWMHNGMINVDNVKMSKSLGNFTTIRDLLQNYDGEMLRFFILSTHYRKIIDFSQAHMESAKSGYGRLRTLAQRLEDDGSSNTDYLKRFNDAMGDDLNTPQAISVAWELARDRDAPGKRQTMEQMDSVLGLDLFKEEELEIPMEIEKLATEREEARRSKDWTNADMLRDEISQRGWRIDDLKEGYKILKND